MRRFGVLISALTLCSLVSGQQMPLSAFKDSLLPKSGAGDLYSITQSPNRFEVTVARDSLQVIMKNDSTRATFTVFPLRNGKLTGYDYGEAGGFLVRTTNTGISDTIFRGPVQHIFACYGKIFFTNSLWHNTKHYGQMFMLDTNTSKWKANIYLQLDYPIRHCHVTKDTMYFVSYGVLHRMQYGRAVTVTTLPFVPTSMTTQGRFMYFGMRGGYARLDLKTMRYRYFVFTGS